MNVGAVLFVLAVSVLSAVLGAYVVMLKQSSRRIKVLTLLEPLIQMHSRCKRLSVQRGEGVRYELGLEVVEAVRACLVEGGSSSTEKAAEQLTTTVQQWLTVLESAVS